MDNNINLRLYVALYSLLCNMGYLMTVYNG